jgi:hypothetical protein
MYGRIIDGFMSLPKDTPPLRVPQVEPLDEDMVQVLSAKTGTERLAIAAGMFRSARRMISSHLRNQHPDWTPERLQSEIVHRLSHGTR